MPKYKKPVQSVAEEPKYFVKHYWHTGVEGAKSHKDTLMTAALVVAILFLGVVIWQNYSKSQLTSAWGAVTESESITDLQSAATRYAGTSAGPFLKLHLAERYMSADTDQAANLQKAIDTYKEVAQTSTEDAKLCAEYSLGLAYENQGKFDDAKKTFEQTVADAKTAFGKTEPDGGFWAVKAQDAIKNQESRKVTYKRYQSAMALANAAQAQQAIMDMVKNAAQSQPGAVESTGTLESKQAQEIAAPAVNSTSSQPAQGVNQAPTGAAPTVSSTEASPAPSNSK